MADFNLQDFGLRLKQARVRAKLSLEALAKKMNGSVTKQAISKYEKGQMAPSSSTLIALATALGADINHFFRPISPDLQNLEVSFRKKSNISAKDVAALKIDIQDDIERFLEIEEILGKDGKKPYVIDNVGIISDTHQMEKLAIKLREKWSLGSSPILNIQDTLELNGIKVIFCDGPIGFDGVSGAVNQDTLIMVLNTKVDMIERQRFTAMHELAHLLFNNHFDASLTKKEQEHLCHAFANEMLVPGVVLRNFFEDKRRISLRELIFVQEQYGISIDAIMYKLHELSIVGDKRYHAFNIRKNQEPGLKEEIETSRFEEIKTSRFEAMVYGALASELITESKAASLLKVPLESVRENLTFV